MTTNDKLYLRQVSAWVKAQEFAILTCDMNISQKRQQVKAAQKAIKLEEAEKSAKLDCLKQVKKEIEEFKKEHGLKTN